MTNKPGKHLTPINDATPWDAHNQSERTRACASWLYVHDFLTQNEYQHAHKRIKQWETHQQPDTEPAQQP